MEVPNMKKQSKLSTETCITKINSALWAFCFDGWNGKGTHTFPLDHLTKGLRSMLRKDPRVLAGVQRKFKEKWGWDIEQQGDVFLVTSQQKNGTGEKQEDAVAKTVMHIILDFLWETETNGKPLQITLEKFGDALTKALREEIARTLRPLQKFFVRRFDLDLRL